MKKNFYKKWNNAPIEDWGSVTSPSYRKFENAARRELNKIMGEIGATVISFNKSHYDFSAFIERGGKYAYIRYCSDLTRQHVTLDCFLYRIAESEKDYHGKTNCYCRWDELQHEIDKIL